MTAFKDKMKENKKVVQVAVGGVIVTLVVGSLVWAGTRKNAYSVMIDGEVVAVVQTKEEVNKAYEEVVASLKQDAGTDIAVKEQIEVEAVHSSKKELSQYDTLVEALTQSISYNVEAYEILVDGTSYAVVGSEEEADSVLENIAKGYLPRKGEVTLSENETTDPLEAKSSKNEETGTSSKEPKEVVETMQDATEVIEVEEALPNEEVARVIHIDSFEVEDGPAPEGEGQKIRRSVESFDFNEEVIVKNVYVNKEDVLSETEAEKQLLAPALEVVDYIVVEGDNTWDIAMQYGMREERLLELNPEIEDETKLQIGQVIKVEKTTPVLSITTVEEATYKQVIPGDIEYVVFSNLYEGQTKVYQEGSDGLKEVTVSVTKVNGEEVGRELVSETVISEPVTKVIGYGVKKKPVEQETAVSSGNGGYIHPLKGRGCVSSGYGSRWGRFHKGIDFAASAGTPIYASAEGKVVYSGYNTGGYGNLVIIEHSNGAQTYYAHCSRLYVNVGDKVSQGQRIAGVGTTGDSTGNHLHFEIRIDGSPVNPSKYL